MPDVNVKWVLAEARLGRVARRLISAAITRETRGVEVTVRPWRLMLMVATGHAVATRSSTEALMCCWSQASPARLDFMKGRRASAFVFLSLLSVVQGRMRVTANGLASYWIALVSMTGLESDLHQCTLGLALSAQPSVMVLVECARVRLTLQCARDLDYFVLRLVLARTSTYRNTARDTACGDVDHEVVFDEVCGVLACKIDIEVEKGDLASGAAADENINDTRGLDNASMHALITQIYLHGALIKSRGRTRPKNEKPVILSNLRALM
ncbi:hypothetical protein PAXINDRAFT_181671 [Paxillus involutus ATCC 200175]|uniref:Uncharacterized protein n=1 Tax=Paxillus involutus ATCC 200175 TaxID=664439 RepID=A0A0C9TWK4_PAXIN|nr:hypothetical protein PAXINDRAFT_181671 [Paxillus involutus ATCC 200175]